jgi:hypothetical protein
VESGTRAEPAQAGRLRGLFTLRALLRWLALERRSTSSGRASRAECGQQIGASERPPCTRPTHVLHCAGVAAETLHWTSALSAGRLEPAVGRNAGSAATRCRSWHTCARERSADGARGLHALYELGGASRQSGGTRGQPRPDAGAARVCARAVCRRCSRFVRAVRGGCCQAVEAWCAPSDSQLAVTQCARCVAQLAAPILLRVRGDRRAASESGPGAAAARVDATTAAAPGAGQRVASGGGDLLAAGVRASGSDCRVTTAAGGRTERGGGGSWESTGRPSCARQPGRVAQWWGRGRGEADPARLWDPAKRRVAVCLSTTRGPSESIG